MKKLLLIAFLVVASTTLSAQNNERIKAFKMGYITEQLNLSTSEAEKFWPIFNEFEDKMSALRKRERDEIKQKLRNGFDTMSDKEAELLITKSMDIAQQQHDLRMQLHKDLRGVISAKKIIKLKLVEDNFKRRLLEQYRKRQGKRNWELVS